jgi:4-diphosphocytidyl-2-C-methyl-D-erythritol kinase
MPSIGRRAAAKLAAAARVEQAPAKINLTLHVVGRRPDGYHEIESLVAFARVGDRLTLTPGRPLALSVRGPMAQACGPVGDNLVLKAATLLADCVGGLKVGHFQLWKRLPVAAGLGGGSSDAAAALRLLARANGLASNDPRLTQTARATGADVPVCLDPRPRLMRGIGEILSDPVALPVLPVVLVNPGVMLATKDVFAAKKSVHPVAGGCLHSLREFAFAQFPDSNRRAGLLNGLKECRNDLETAAMELAPEIAVVLAALRDQSSCWLARMSGSGATCFGIFDSVRSAQAAGRALRHEHPLWWVRATALGTAHKQS